MKPKANNCHINPVLYAFYLRLKDTLGAEIVHRRKRKSNTCIEVIFYDEIYKYLKGRLNTLKEAEECGYWVICRLQSKRGHEVYHSHRVFQLYLSPVHPKKRREAAHLIEMTEEVTFKPISARPINQRLHRSSDYSAPTSRTYRYKPRRNSGIRGLSLRTEGALGNAVSEGLIRYPHGLRRSIITE